MASLLAASLLLAGSFEYLHRLDARRCSRAWAVAWSLQALWALASILEGVWSSPVATLLKNEAHVFSGMFILFGAYWFLGRRLPRHVGWAGGATAAIVAVSVGLGAAAGETGVGGAAWTLGASLAFAYVGAALVLAGVAFLMERKATGGGSGYGVAGALHIILGVHKLDYPLLRPVEWFAPWGYTISTVLVVAVVVSLLFVYFIRLSRELEESNARFHSLFAGATSPLLVFDAETGEIIEANEAAAQMYEYAMDELLSMNILDLETMSSDATAVDLDSARQRRTPAVAHHRHRTASGRVLAVEAFSGVQELDGRDVVFAFLRDITEQEETAQALVESERRYSELFEGNRVPTLVVDPETLQVRDANPAAVEFYSGEGELRGRNLADFSASGELDLAGALGEALEGDSEAIQMRHRRADGSLRDVEVQVSPVSIGGRTHLAMFVWDVTEANRALAELRRYRDNLEKIVEARTAELQKANAELLQASRAKSRFLAAMSHELRTPLNSIIGFSGILLEGLAGELTEEQRRQVEMVNRSGKHLLALINDILDLSKIEAGRATLHFKDTDVRRVVGEVVESLRPQADEKGLSLVLEPTGGPCVIRTDPTKVRQVVFNLVGNAVKFTEEGSVTVDVASDGKKVRISVTDTGPGLSDEDVAQAFEEFKQLEPGKRIAKTPGTGLGLPLSRRLARLLGGSLEVESEVGVGSTFTLVLPLLSASTEGQEEEARRITAESTNGSRLVLLVDDDISVHDLYRLYLTQAGYRVIHAYDLDAALGLLSVHPVDLVVLDQIVEMGSGWRLLERMRETPGMEHIPVVVIGSSDSVGDAEESGAQAFLREPVSREALVEAVQAALG